MENQEKEPLKPDLIADNSDQELTNNMDGTKAVPESEMMNDDGTDNLETGNINDLNRDKRDDEKTNQTQMNSKLNKSELPNDVPNDETPPSIDMPRGYDKMNEKARPDDSTEKK